MRSPHMSLMVQPAPLINTAPAPNRVSMSRGGRQPGAAASPMLQAQGRYSSHVPSTRRAVRTQPSQRGTGPTLKVDLKWNLHIFVTMQSERN